MKQRLSLLLSLGYCTLSQGVFLNAATAQVAPDGTTNTTVDISGNDFTIEQGDRAGGNLFHSFSDFSVPNGGSAFFNNAADIVNIFSRVTGGNISNIDGLLGANGTANLFLINPAGIIFGAGARLDIGGSFYGSTADSIIFPDGEFSAADLTNQPVLTINAPIGLNFRDNPGDIVNRSDLRETEDITNIIDDEVEQLTIVDRIGLQVNPGENFTLVGGNIVLDDSGITAPGGRVNLGGLSEAGEINFNPDGSLTFPNSIARTDVTLADGASVNVSADGGGFINVNARNLTLLDQSSLLGGIAQESAFPDAQAGDITINTTSIIAKGNSIISTATDGIGNAGNINITTNTLEFNDEFSTEELAAQFFQDDLSSRLIASTFGHGDGGNITVNAEENVSFDGSGGGMLTTVGVRGNDDNVIGVKGKAGDILVNANSVSITNGAGFIVSTIGEGNGGNIFINARDTVTMEGLGDPIPQFNAIRPTGLKTQVGTNAVGNAGTIEINTNVLSTSRAEILANTSGMGNAGDIIINAQDNSTLQDRSLLLTQLGGKGEGGDIEIKAKSLILNNRSQLLADTKGDGNAGNITINVQEQLALNQNSLILAQVNENTIQGNAGNIEINTSSLELRGEALILANTRGNGDSGSITIQARDQLSLSEGSLIRVGVNQGAEGNSGNLNIDSPKIFLEESSITSSTNGQGEGGDINITADFLSLDNFSLISASTRGGAIGDAGNLNINSNEIRVSNGGIISSFTNSGFSGGNIAINTGTLELINGGNLLTGTDSIGNAGNINLKVSDRIIIDGSNPAFRSLDSEPFGDQILNDLEGRTGILANASPNSNGNGGDININTKFIIAIPNQNSDIIANALQGNGGDINISAEALFGIEERPLNNISNDINASSEFGLDGNVSIVTPDTNKIQTDTKLPSNPIELEQTVVQACQGDRYAGSSNRLTVKGQGGVAAQPTDTLTSDVILVDDQELNIPSNVQTQHTDIKPIATSKGDIYPARGIIKTESGKIVLTAYATDNLNNRTPNISANCGLVGNQ